MPDLEPAVSVAGLTKRYGAKTALDGLSFEVARGEIFALLGPNGAGKTTTIEILEGFRAPDEGTARVLGLDPGSKALKPRVGVMLQGGGIYPGIRVGEAVTLFASLYEDPLAPQEALELAGMQDQKAKTVRQLSGGEKQRLSLALALLPKPEVAFLDEPTAGMDPHGRASTWKALRGLKEAGTTVMLTTHLLDEAELLADRVAIIDKGSLVGLGPPDSFRTPQSRLDFRTDRPLDVQALGRDLGAQVERGDAEGSYGIEGPPSPALIARLAAWMAEHDILLLELGGRRGALEETFLRLTSGAQEP